MECLEGRKMNGSHSTCGWRMGLLLTSLCCGITVVTAAPPEGPDGAATKPGGKSGDILPQPKRVPFPPPDPNISREIEASLPQLPASILPTEANAVDLACVLRLAGVENPEILIARQ